MGNNTFLVEEKSRNVGNFMVGRLLPFIGKKLVGPFCFIDHMGPAEFGPESYFDVDQHPHIGLCTLTYLLEGCIEHKDSTGASQIIKPGSVNLMVSGKGVAHTERTPREVRESGIVQRVHGYQVWIALPKNEENRSPSFHHIPKNDLPCWEENGLEMVLVTGKGYGRQSPTPAFSEQFMLDVKCFEEKELCINGELEGEIAVVVVKGAVKVGDQEVEAGQMLVSNTENECSITLMANTQVLLFGGEPFPERRYMYWNFISSDMEVLEQAKEDWKNYQFPKINGDETYIPLPK